MFDGITTKAGSGARRGSSMAVSVVVHGAVIVLAFAIGYVKSHMPKEEEPVAVVFHAPPPPPPPPPPAGHKKTTPHEHKPITPKVPIHTIIQPKEVPKVEEKKPDPAPVEDDTDDDDEGVEGGVEGGVVGGVVGGQIGGTVGSTGEGPPQFFGAGMSRPVPTADCQPQRPIPPEQARAMGITGMVLVEYVVHSDGHVGEVELKNPTAPPILFEAVKNWLLHCPYTPSMSGSKPIAVKMITPFMFKPEK